MSFQDLAERKKLAGFQHDTEFGCKVMVRQDSLLCYFVLFSAIIKHSDLLFVIINLSTNYSFKTR